MSLPKDPLRAAFEAEPQAVARVVQRSLATRPSASSWRLPRGLIRGLLWGLPALVAAGLAVLIVRPRPQEPAAPPTISWTNVGQVVLASGLPARQQARTAGASQSIVIVYKERP